MSGMNIAERAAGRRTFALKAKKRHPRSTVPTVYGERSLRLSPGKSSESRKTWSIRWKKMLAIILAARILLVTGPTGPQPHRFMRFDDNPSTNGSSRLGTGRIRTKGINQSVFGYRLTFAGFASHFAPGPERHHGREFAT